MRESLSATNGYVKKGLPRKIVKAPFYAIEVSPAIHYTMGGEKIFNTTFFSRTISNLNDEIVSCIVVAMILEKIPKNIYKKITS